MKSFAPFQRLHTLYIGAAGGEITQSPRACLDAVERTSLDLHVEILALSAGTLVLEGAVTEDGPFKVLATWTAPVDVTLNLMTYYSAQNPLARLLRWRFAHTTTAAVTFRMRWQ